MSLSPLWGPRPRARQQPDTASLKERAPAPAAEHAPVPAPVSAEVQRRIAIEHLTPDDVADLSVTTINTLVPLNPKLIAQLIIDSGKRRRAELPMNTSTLRPLARCILLAGEKRRGQELSDADEEFLNAYLDEIGAS
jgi:hypothetical protein